MQFPLRPAGLGGLFTALCGTELVLAALPTRQDAPATSPGAQGRKVLLGRKTKGSQPLSLKEQTRHHLLPEVSLGNAQLVGALGITVTPHKCCLKTELKCDCSRYSLAVNKEIKHIAMQGFAYFSVVMGNC